MLGMLAAGGEKDALLRAGICVAAALCLAWLWLFFSFTADDAFITFRYGRNLIEHGVWNWNSSGPRAEAYTSGLYALLSIVPAALGLAPAALFKFLGIAAFLLTLQRLWHYGGFPAFAFGVTIAAVTPFLFVHLASGLETPVFILLIVEISARLIGGSAQHRQGIFYACLVLLPFIRPEGAAFSAVAGALLVRQLGWRNVEWLPLAIASLCGLAYFIARWIYFGQPLPTPFYAKTGFNPADLIANLQAFRLYLIVAAALLLLIGNWTFRSLLLAQLAIVLTLYGPAHLQMNFADRFAVQALLPLILVAPIALLHEKTAILSRRLRLAVLGLMALMAGVGNLSQGALTWLIGYSPASNQAHRALGLALAPLQSRGYTIAMADSGLIAYHAGWRAIDLVGLADSEVARHGNSLAYMEQTKPDVVVLYSTSERPQDLMTRGFGHEAAIDFLQRKQWKPIASLPWNETYWLIVFRREDMADGPALDLTLQRIAQEARSWSEQRLRTRVYRALSLQDAFL
jgi:hypothetical protein